MADSRKGKRKRSDEAGDMSVGKTRRTVCNEEREVTCPFCSHVIAEATEEAEGQEAVYCEGICKSWLHRWCAGVRKEDYDPLSSSQEQFLCRSCTISVQQNQIDSLIKTVKSLSVTVDTLQASVTTLESEVSRLKKSRVSSEAASKVAWETVRLKKRSNPKKSDNTKTSKPKDLASSTRSPPTHSPGVLVEVPGARKIWGTVKATSSSAVSSTLKRLTSAGTKLFVKKKSQPASEGRHERWWFIVL